jgi:hypothetical protein
MRRWLTVFLLILLPLQLSWAVAATYCAHEADPAVNHVGHHQHRHEASGGASQASVEPGLTEASKTLDGSAGTDAGTDAGKAAGKAADDSPEKATDKALTCVDDDCGFCHLGHSQPVASTPIVLPAVAAPIVEGAVPEVWSSRGPDRRERPNWRIA